MSEQQLDVVARLSAGESIDTVMLSLLAPVVRLTLMRCAAVRTFDEELYRAILSGLGGPELEALRDAGHVEPVSGENLEFRVAGMRESLFTAWWADEHRPAAVTPPVPSKLAEFAACLAQEQRRRERRRAMLDALLLSDQSAAAELVNELYDEADRRDDLAGCQDVLDVLDQPDRMPLITGTSLAEIRDDRHAYLAARTLWASDFHRSARYFPRPQAERWLYELISSEHDRVLQLYARGGMGKTMQLRWFLSRYCVLSPHRIPCARIDFDAEDATRAARHPWLLLLKIAEQLETQLVGEHFQAILDSYGPFTPLLYRSTNKGFGESLPAQTDAVDGQDVVDRFVSVLAERPREAPALIVIDTCEELLRAGVDATNLFGMLADVVQRVPAMRLVLAGRYRLTSHDGLETLGSDVGQLFSGWRTRRVRRFTEREQKRYLADVRGIRDPEIRKAVGERAKGMPFHLATFADLIRLDPEITPEEIRTAEGPTLLYCIERILKRVEDDVRWLLFYGVVPRRLSLDFLERVMRPFLIEGMASGGTRNEPPLDGELPLRQVAPPRTDPELRYLWERLLAYAARYSWVWIEDDGTVRFHDDVIEPLRGLARGRGFYAPLHRAAIAYYEQQAAEDQEHWPEWTCEALFHRFQLEGSRAAEHWRRTVHELRERGRPGWLLTVASEPLRRDYFDDEAHAYQFANGEYLVNWQTVAEAHIHCGWALAEEVLATLIPVRALSAVGSRRSLWGDVETHLRAARQISERFGARLPEPETALLQARLALAGGRATDAQSLLEDHQDAAPTMMSREVGRAYRLALHLQGQDDAWSEFAASWGASDPYEDPLASQRSAVTIADTSAERGRFREALEWVVRAREIGGAQGQADYLLQNHVSLLCINGRFGEADVVAQQFGGGIALFARTFALLAGRRPREALALADRATPEALSGDVPADYTADLLALRGLANAKLLQFEEARADLNAAVALARRLRDANSEATYAALAGTIQMRGAGDLRNAAACLDDAEDADARHDDLGWLAARLGKAELLARTGRQSEGLELLKDARDAAGSVSAKVAVAVCELQVVRGGTDRAVRELIRWLEAVNPPAARLSLLSELTEVEPLSAVSAPARERLRVVVLAGLSQRLPFKAPDAALMALLAAEVHRITCHEDDARRLLEESVRHSANDNPYLWWCWLEALQRCGPARPDEPAPPGDPFTEYGDFPGLRAAWLIRLVEHRGHLESVSWANKHLTSASLLLNSRPALPSRWRAKLDESLTKFGHDPSDTRAAHHAAATASATWATLGNEYKRKQIADEFVLGQARPTRDEGSVELRLGVDKDGKRQPLGVSWVVRLANGRELTPRPFDPQRLLGSVPSDLNSRLRAASRRIAEDLNGWGRMVGSGLVEVPQLAADLAASGGTYDARFVCLDSEAAALPWELAALPGDPGEPISLRPGPMYRCLSSPARDEHKVSAAQAALIRLGHLDGHPDGLTGTLTEQAVRSFQQSNQLRTDGVLSRETWRRLRTAIADVTKRRPLRVLMLHADTDGDASGIREVPLRSADAAAAYRSRGARVAVVNVGHIARRVARVVTLIDEPPDVVHVQLGVELVGGAVVLDTRRLVDPTSAGWAAGTPHLPAAIFSDLTNLLSQGSFGPVVVLETPWLRSRSESVRSMLLRNVFAHLLLELGRTVAVLCTGGGPPRIQHATYGILAEGMASGLDIAEVVGRLRQHPSAHGGIEEVLPSRGCALFLQRPPYSLFPAGCA